MSEATERLMQAVGALLDQRRSIGPNPDRPRGHYLPDTPAVRLLLDEVAIHHAAALATHSQYEQPRCRNCGREPGQIHGPACVIAPSLPVRSGDCQPDHPPVPGEGFTLAQTREILLLEDVVREDLTALVELLAEQPAIPEHVREGDGAAEHSLDSEGEQLTMIALALKNQGIEDCTPEEGVGILICRVLEIRRERDEALQSHPAISKEQGERLERVAQVLDGKAKWPLCESAADDAAFLRSLATEGEGS